MLLPLIVAGAFAVTSPPPREVPSPHRAAPPFCSLVPGSALALLRVEKDTTLTVRGRTLRVVLQRIDTLSTRRPF